MPSLLPYSVQCAGCNTTHGSEAEGPFQFIAAAKALGWVIPSALENKPIKCPECASTGRKT